VLDERIGLFEPSHDEEIGRLNSKKSKSPQCLQPSLSTLSMKEWLAKILQRVDTRLDKLDNEGTETQWASQTVEAGRSCQMGQARRSVRGKASHAHQRRAQLPNLLRSGWPFARDLLQLELREGESDPQSRHGAFARAIAKAGAQACRALHTAVQRSDPKWILERRFVNDYGPPS